MIGGRRPASMQWIAPTAGIYVPKCGYIGGAARVSLWLGAVEDRGRHFLPLNPQQRKSKPECQLFADFLQLHPQLRTWMEAEPDGEF